MPITLKQAIDSDRDPFQEDPSLFRMPGNGLCEFAREDGQESKENHIKLTLYDGSVQKHWYWGNFAFDLATMKLARKRIPILLDHFTDQRLGYSTSASFDGKFVMEGKLLQSSELAQRIRTESREGFPFESSLRFDPDKSKIERLSKGQTAQINDRKITGPGTIVRNAFIIEGSVTSLGALGGTRTHIFQQTMSNSDKETHMDLAQFQQEHPDLHVQICEQAENKGRQAAMACFQELSEAVGEDPALVIRCFSEGKTVAEALKLHNEQLQAENTELAEQLKRQTPVPTSDKAPEKPTPEKTDPALAEFSDEQTDTDKGQNSGNKTEAQFRAAFKQDQQLQIEFGGDEDAYVAYCQAENEGRVKRLTS